MPNSTYPIVVLASRNQKKIGEIRELLAPFGIPLKSVSDFESISEVVEDGDSFRANAEKKAIEVALATEHWAIGEDSGLQVDALNGAPGIYSARFSGPNATDEENNDKLLAELNDIPVEKRGAGYVCHVAVSDPSGKVQLNVEATCRGRIIHEAKGTNGFGYDPYFEIPEYRKTFGQFKPIVKQQISHRAKAFERLIPELLKTLSKKQ